MPSCGSPCLDSCGYGGAGIPSCVGNWPTGDCGSYAYGGYPSYPSYPTYPTAPLAAPAASAVQNAVYSYPAGYGYGYSQAPAYWYGR